jgi:heme oxygenase (mycobilin-producing)
MNIHITSGTFPFMMNIKKKHQKKHSIILMQSEADTLLVHETNGKSIFQTPRSYEVISHIGVLQQKGFCVMHYIPIDEEAIDVFEYRLKNHSLNIELFYGFQAFRALRPKKGNTYVLMSVWKDANAYSLSEKLYTFPDSLIQEFSLQMLKMHSPTYVRKYWIPKEEDLEK